VAEESGRVNVFSAVVGPVNLVNPLPVPPYVEAITCVSAAEPSKLFPYIALAVASVAAVVAVPEVHTVLSPVLAPEIEDAPAPIVRTELFAALAVRVRVPVFTVSAVVKVAFATVADSPVQLPELPDVFPVTFPVRFPAKVEVSIPVEASYVKVASV